MLALRSDDLITFATILIGLSAGVGCRYLTFSSAVTVHGGLSKPFLFIKCHAAVQLQWQSRRLAISPPYSIPGNA